MSHSRVPCRFHQKYDIRRRFLATALLPRMPGETPLPVPPFRRGQAAADIFLVEGFRLDPRGGVLFRRDQQGVFAPIAIGRRALDILDVLVEWPGDLVSRDEIIETVWPGTVVGDSNLNVQIAALRRILDDGRA